MDVEERIRNIITEQLSIKPEEVKPETKFTDIGVDSLDTIEMVMALEESFAIEIPDEEAERLLTVKDAVDYTKKKIEDKSKA